MLRASGRLSVSLLRVRPLTCLQARAEGTLLPKGELREDRDR